MIRPFLDILEFPPFALWLGTPYLDTLFVEVPRRMKDPIVYVSSEMLGVSSTMGLRN